MTTKMDLFQELTEEDYEQLIRSEITKEDFVILNLNLQKQLTNTDRENTVRTFTDEEILK